MQRGEGWSRNSSPGPAVVQGAVGEEIVAALASNKDITALVSSKVGVAGALVSNSAAAALNPDPCFHLPVADLSLCQLHNYKAAVSNGFHEGRVADLSLFSSLIVPICPQPPPAASVPHPLSFST